MPQKLASPLPRRLAPPPAPHLTSPRLLILGSAQIFRASIWAERHPALIRQ